MYFVELLKNYWEVLAGFIAGSIWIGRISQRVTSLEKAPPCPISVSPESCKQQRDDCKKFFSSELLHGEKQFVEIKAMIAEMSKLSEERHKCIMDHLLRR